MAEYSVLIAEASEDLRRELAGRLGAFCSVQACENAEDVLTAFARQEPRVLVLDLMLPGMDGLSLLEAIRASGRRPGVVAISSYISPYILECAARLGADCVLAKPFEPGILMGTVARLLRQESREEEDLRQEISCQLLMLGICAKRRGYAYLQEAIFQSVQDPDRSLVKELYAGIGEQYGISANLVEHAIRGAIRDAWERRNRQLWLEYFGAALVKKPTSALFIHTAARHFRAGFRRASGEN